MSLVDHYLGWLEQVRQRAALGRALLERRDHAAQGEPMCGREDDPTQHDGPRGAVAASQAPRHRLGVVDVAHTSDPSTCACRSHRLGLGLMHTDPDPARCTCNRVGYI